MTYDRFWAPVSHIISTQTSAQEKLMLFEKLSNIPDCTGSWSLGYISTHIFKSQVQHLLHPDKAKTT